MNYETVVRWQNARTLTDLGILSAEFFEDGTAHPHTSMGWPDDDAVRFTLADLNRAGFVVLNYLRGAGYHRRAAVQGFCDTLTLEWLTTCLARSRYQAVAVTTLAENFGDQLNRGVLVDKGAASVDLAHYGRQLSADQVAEYLFGGVLNLDAVRSLVGAWNVTIFDPEWGVDTLWPALAAAADPEHLDADRHHRRQALSA